MSPVASISGTGGSPVLQSNRIYGVARTLPSGRLGEASLPVGRDYRGRFRVRDTFIRMIKNQIQLLFEIIHFFLLF